MTCRAAREILYPAPERAPERPDTAEARAHVRECAACRAYFAAAEDWSARFREKAGREEAPAHLVGEVESLGDPQRLLVVAETAAKARRERRVERFFASVAERRVAHVVTEADRFDEVFVQAQSAGDDACDARRLERVRHARAVVVAGGVDEDLGLALQPPERLRVHNAVAIALERRPDPALVLLA